MTSTAPSARQPSARPQASVAQTDAQISSLALQAGSVPAAPAFSSLPRWLQQELRSDHAGEFGAVMIYRGILAISRDTSVREFAESHLRTEQKHLALMEEIVPAAGRTRLLPLWRLMGWLTGALPALFGRQAVFATIEAVETFVEEHYMAQIRRLRYEAAEEGLCSGDQDNANEARKSLKARAELISMLNHCCEDEVHHKEEARDRAAEGPFPWFLWVDTSWQWFVQAGSAVAANCAKRI